MGRYKTEKIYYEKKEWPPEDIIVWGFTCARRHPELAIEIAAHLLNAAIIYNDEELTNAGRELMYAAGSPCYFVPNDSAEQAMSNNNRPSDYTIPKMPRDNYERNEVDEEWDDCMDFIFNDKLNPQALKKALEEIKYSPKITERRFYYVSYRIFDIINYFSKGTTEHQYLQWINLHFNCGWVDDKAHKHLFRFKLDGTSKKLQKQHPSEWDENTMYGGLGTDHHTLAITLKNTFTYTIVEGNLVENSESFEHLKDRPRFLSGAMLIKGDYFALDEAYINKG